MSASDPKPDSQESGRAGFWTFWTTLPGVLTGSAALLTAIIGLVTLLDGSPDERRGVPGVGSIQFVFSYTLWR